MQKAIHASISATSFAMACEDLKQLAEVSISDCRLRRLVERIGSERMAQVQQQSQAYQEMPIPQRKECPLALAPVVACIECDGGRMQIRNEGWGAQGGKLAEPAQASYWRETKVAALLKMTSQSFDKDPCPTVPLTFVDAARMKRLAREIKGYCGSKPEAEQTTNDLIDLETLMVSTDQLHAATRPKPLLRSVLASTRSIHEFGKLVVAAAHGRGFHAAKKRAFVCDGMACNWTIHAKYFSSYTAIVDFVHALCYVYHAALAGRDAREAWRDYQQWAQWLWSGQTEPLISAISERQQVIGQPQPNEPETSPRQLVASALTYLRNQKSRMKYDEYRRQGLPITSAYIESTIKQINRRVKGSEKFWSKNADAVLQLRADQISETQPMNKFWQNRSQNLPTCTHYKMSA